MSNVGDGEDHQLFLLLLRVSIETYLETWWHEGHSLQEFREAIFSTFLVTRQEVYDIAQPLLESYFEED